MPNKHSHHRTQLSVWTDKELKKYAQAILKEKGLSLTDEIEKLLIKIIKQYEKEQPTTTKRSK